MYHVQFSSAPYAECKTVEEAVSLALAVHQSSNLFHCVKVLSDDGVVVISLVLEKR